MARDATTGAERRVRQLVENDVRHAAVAGCDPKAGQSKSGIAVGSGVPGRDEVDGLPEIESPSGG